MPPLLAPQNRSKWVSSQPAEAAAAQRGGAGDRAQMCGAHHEET